MGETRARDLSLDVFKGLLVALMVYCHVLQFFGDPSLFSAIPTLCDGINLLVFPGFVFAFGCAASGAYLDKPFEKVWHRMLRSALKALGAFWLSGIAFRVLRENKPFASGTVRRILLLEDIPGWSEFLLAFALYALIAMALFIPLRALRKRPIWAIPAGALCLLGCFLPYNKIDGSYLGLLIGARDQTTFPILQYAPYFLAGVVWSARPGKPWLWALGATVLTGAGALLSVLGGGLPQRFPPALGWVLLPPAGVAALYALAHFASRVPWLRVPLTPLGSMGARSLYYLIATNLAIFTLAGKGIAPMMKIRGRGLWGMPIQSPTGALCWTFALLLACAFVAWIAGIGMRTRAKD